MTTFKCEICGKRKKQPSTGYRVRAVCAACEITDGFIRNVEKAVSQHLGKEVELNWKFKNHVD